MLTAYPTVSLKPSTKDAAELGNNSISGTTPQILLQTYIKKLEANFLQDVWSASPLLTDVAHYYACLPSKKIRPCLILLMARATNGLGRDWAAKQAMVDCDANPPEVRGVSSLSGTVLDAQMRLAEIVEMIHVASLLHDDVIDESPLRRGAPSAPSRFGSKVTVLGGDFLLGRAMSLCAGLADIEVMNIVASVISTLVEGELLQAREAAIPTKAVDTPLEWDSYLRKTYMKTASLFSRALRCAVILGGAAVSDPWRDIAATYGTELGMAFQLVDDVLDYEGGAMLGKPVDAADLKLGIATAPVFFAMEENVEMRPLVARRFQGLGDVAAAVAIVRSTKALIRSKELARLYATRARNALAGLPSSEAKSALEALAMDVVTRDR